MAIYNCPQCGAILPYSGAACSSCARKRADEQRWRNQSSSLSSYVSNGSSSSSNSYTSGTYSASSYHPDNFTGRKSQKFTDGSRYYGDFVDGKRHGKGTNYFADGAKYDGDFKNGYMNGYGLMVYADGEKYDGEWADGKRHGQGTHFYTNGAKYVGEWVNNQKQGKGAFYYVNPQALYDGDWHADERHGYGVEEIYTDEGTQRYEGAFKFGKRNGYGKMICADGETYEGEYKEGKRHGKGRCVLPDGTVQDGYFENGDFLGNTPPKITATHNADTGMDISPDMLAKFMQGGNIPQSQSASASRPQPEKEIWAKLLPMTVEQRNDFLASHPEITIPAGIKKIPQKMFYNCTNLTSIRFNEDLREIEAYAFMGCKNLGAVLEFPSSVERICRFAFATCSSVKKVILPNNITVEEAGLMCGVSAVEFETNPPKGVVLEKGAFRYCNSALMSKETQKKIKDLNPKAFK